MVGVEDVRNAADNANLAEVFARWLGARPALFESQTVARKTTYIPPLRGYSRRE